MPPTWQERLRSCLLELADRQGQSPRPSYAVQPVVWRTVCDLSSNEAAQLGIRRVHEHANLEFGALFFYDHDGYELSPDHEVALPPQNTDDSHRHSQPGAIRRKASA